MRPRAHAKTSRARCANACAGVGRRAQRSSASRSSSLNVSTGMGRPMALSVLLSIARTLNTYTLFHLFQTHETLAKKEGGPKKHDGQNLKAPAVVLTPCRGWWFTPRNQLSSKLAKRNACGQASRVPYGQALVFPHGICREAGTNCQCVEVAPCSDAS